MGLTPYQKVGSIVSQMKCLSEAEKLNLIERLATEEIFLSFDYSKNTLESTIGLMDSDLIECSAHHCDLGCNNNCELEGTISISALYDSIEWIGVEDLLELFKEDRQKVKYLNLEHKPNV